MHGPKEIIEEAEALPVEARAFIIDSLLQGFNRPDAQVDREWLSVARRRLDELRAGTTQPVPGPEVFETIKKRFEK